MWLDVTRDVERSFNVLRAQRIQTFLSYRCCLNHDQTAKQKQCLLLVENQHLIWFPPSLTCIGSNQHRWRKITGKHQAFCGKNIIYIEKVIIMWKSFHDSESSQDILTCETTTSWTKQWQTFFFRGKNLVFWNYYFFSSLESY